MFLRLGNQSVWTESPLFESTNPDEFPRTSAVGADRWAEYFEYEVGKSVNDAWLLVEPWSRVDYAEHPRP